jgi:hypothetical protein
MANLISNFLPLILIFLMLAIALVALAARGKSSVLVQSRPLMTASEIAFWRLLITAVAPLHVAPQVAMGALLDARKGLDRSTLQGARNSFQSKIVDFAIVDDAGVVRLLVELDDRTHSAEKDAKRDAMTSAAGYRTMRVRGQAARDIEQLSRMVSIALAPNVETIGKGRA